jgi:hypothetical protein
MQLCLPDRESWSFANIFEADAERAAALEHAGSADALVDELQAALRSGLREPDEVRFGQEQATDQRGGIRTVVQFCLGAHLFDWLFNGRAGYRAHYLAGPEFGERFNNRVADALLSDLKERLPDTICARSIGAGFSDLGPARMSKDFLVRSLGGGVSKLWVCSERIRADGGVEHLPHAAVGQPRLLLQDGRTWPALGHDDAAAWVDLKGGFVCSEGVWQAQLPERALRLHRTGAI